MRQWTLQIRLLRNLAILLMAILSVCACTHRPVHETQFRRARAVMDSCPERALTILDSIPAADLRPGLDSARYVLLHALAENKAHRLTTSDSLLRSIIPVFQRYKLKDDLRTANYILGTSLDAQERYPEAIGYLIDAEYLIDVSTDPYQKGLIYNELAECCNATLNGDLAMKYIRLAYDAFKIADKPLHAAYALHDRATFLNNNAQYAEAIDLFKETIKAADTLKCDELKFQSTIGMGISHFGLGKFLQAAQKFRSVPSESTALDKQALYIWGKAEHNAGNQVMADSLSEVLLENGDYRWIYMINPVNISTDRVISAYKQREEYSDHMYLNTYRNKFPTAVERNLILREELSMASLKYTRLILLGLGILLLISAAYGYTLMNGYRKRLREKENAMLELTNDFISFSREQRQKVVNASKRLDGAILVTESIMKERISFLHELTYSYYGRSPNSQQTFKEITALVGNLIEDLRSNPSTANDLKILLDTCHNDIFTRLIVEIPTLSDDEKNLFLYCASGFTSHIIQKIYKVEAGALRVRKTRLRKKILSTESPSCKEFLQFL